MWSVAPVPPSPKVVFRRGREYTTATVGPQPSAPGLDSGERMRSLEQIQAAFRHADAASTRVYAKLRAGRTGLEPVEPGDKPSES